MTTCYNNYIIILLENQLFAPSLKGVVDFLRSLQGKGQTKKYYKSMLLNANTHINFYLI